ncbi:MAG: hypothetical protein DRH76_00535 [Deltaproteobacteria bacterium]|nr:MAG: hypothetical protein DRH76_00535 [Deltaproteobacteria bacterium]
MPEDTPLNGTKIRASRRLIACFVILLVGGLGMAALTRMKEKPPERRQVERAIKVELTRAVLEDYPVVITGFGEARAKDIVMIASQVGGTVVKRHPNLEAGGLIGAGEVLFAIDKVDYEAAYEGAAATVRKLEQTVARLEKQLEIDKKRLVTLQRNRDLAQAEYERVQKLFTEYNVGTRSRVDQAEQAANSAADMAAQMGLAVELYPIQIEEAKNGLDAARASAKKAKADLERTVVRAPFDARVVSTSLEKGQIASPGMTVITLADDSELEIIIPIDSRDARDWLRFENDKAEHQTAWFARPVPVACAIHWTEDKQNHAWEGTLDRVVAFNEKTRTVRVAVRIPGAKAFSTDTDRLPLVHGMFCKVAIPGRAMKNVVRLPRRAVTFENTVYIASNSRLKTVNVEVARIQGDDVFISKGIEPGTQVVTTRLVDPLENSLLEDINAPEKPKAEPGGDKGKGEGEA